MASEVPHKFKIGQIVFYRPKQRMLSASRGTYTVTGLVAVSDGQQPEYRIRHFTEEVERVAFENELSAESGSVDTIEPRGDLGRGQSAISGEPGRVEGMGEVARERVMRPENLTSAECGASLDTNRDDAA
jgi:hypothetical protein